MKEINEDELGFVARHYVDDALNTDRAWQRFRQLTAADTTPSRRRLSPAMRRIAASVSIALIVGASVACGVWYASGWNAAEAPTEGAAANAPLPYRYVQPKDEGVVLKYDNAPIDDVLSELEAHYGRRLTLQTAAEDRYISGEIEASTLEEIIEILEETLDIKIEMK